MKKNILILCLLTLLGSSAFAKLNVRVNGFAGYGFLTTEPIKTSGFFFPELSLNVDYEIPLSGGDSIGTGVTAGALLFPGVQLDVSYIHCLQAQSSNEYKWYVEPELHGGVGIVGLDVVQCYPFFTVDALFTYKPTSKGLYFGFGPGCYFMVVPEKNKPSCMIMPGFDVSVGYTL